MGAGRIFGIVAVVAVFFVMCGDDNGTNPNTTPSSDTFTDSRDGKDYKTVKIGNQWWFAKNLNYATNNSKCYSNSPDNCVKYGRLYTLADAKTACPLGWHLPSEAEWDTLMVTVGGVKDGYSWLGAGTKLKSSNGWNSYSGVSIGADMYGFSALPGGRGSTSSDDFDNAGYSGYWWSSTEYGPNAAPRIQINYSIDYASIGMYTDYLYSVRCVKN